MFFPLPHIESCPKRIRAYYKGSCVLDTKNAKLVWQHSNSSPTYFFTDDDLPDANSGISDKIQKGSGDLSGLFTVPFTVIDDWFEEDEQIFVHPKDPYKRVDILQSSRHVRVEFNGQEVANTRMPRLLFETGLPVRTYIPKVDSRLDLLEPSVLLSQCPYKGEAKYYHIITKGGKGENLVWWYQNPTPEAAAIKGYLSFFDEKVDVWVDGVKQVRPAIKWL